MNAALFRVGSADAHHTSDDGQSWHWAFFFSTGPEGVDRTGHSWGDGWDHHSESHE